MRVKFVVVLYFDHFLFNRQLHINMYTPSVLLHLNFGSLYFYSPVAKQGLHLTFLVYSSPGKKGIENKTLNQHCIIKTIIILL